MTFTDFLFWLCVVIAAVVLLPLVAGLFVIALLLIGVAFALILAGALILIAFTAVGDRSVEAIGDLSCGNPP